MIASDQQIIIASDCQRTHTENSNVTKMQVSSLASKCLFLFQIR